jgi:hypothetical protein
MIQLAKKIFLVKGGQFAVGCGRRRF